MIKILFFIDSLSGGGAEKVLRTLVNNMDKSKFAVTVMTSFPEDAENLLVPGIAYRSLYSKKSRLNELLLRIEAELGLTYRLRMKGDYDIEVAYLECAPTKILAGSTNKKAVKLAWVHCDLKKKAVDPESFAKKCAPWYAKYDKVVCVSENVRQSYREMFGDVFDASVIYNVNDESDIIKKSQRTVIPRTDILTFAAVGRLSHEKGNDRLLEACARLKQSGYDFRCWIVGEGPQRTALEKLIAQHDLHEQVKMSGFQENPYPYMAGADFVVCPSRFEGFSTVVTESLILGKPVVTTECSGMRELLGDSEYGLIMENSEQGIYEGLKAFLDDPALLNKYRVLAEQRGQKFRKETLIKQTEVFLTAELTK